MQDRIRGCLVGQFVGDALGSQVEFMNARNIKSRFPGGVREISHRLTWDTLPGQITDDSEMALALARTLAKMKRYDRQAVLSAYRDWLRSGPFDCGNTIRSSLKGFPNPDSQANGALMRVSPLGIWGAAQDRETLWQAAEEDAMLTHIHPVCRQVNRIFASLLAEAMRTAKDGKALYGHLCRCPEDWCGAPILPEIRECILRAGSEKPVLDAQNKGWVLLAFRNALWQMIHATSFEDAVVDTVMGGGDTDTNAAICGALMGAICGHSSIPGRWSAMVLSCKPDKEHHAACPRPKFYWTADALSLADALAGLDSDAGNREG